VIRFMFDLGPQCHFGTVKVEGEKRIMEDTILERVAFQEGELFDPEKLERTEGKLFALGVFSSVRASYRKRDRNPIVNVTIHVAESTQHELRLGFGAAVDQTHFEGHLRGGYTIHGVFDVPLLTFRSDLTPGWSVLRTAPFTSGPAVDAVGAFDKDDFLLYELHGEVLGEIQRQPHIGYILTGPRVAVGITYPLFDDLKAFVGWQLQYLVFQSYDPTVFNPQATEAWLGYYTQSLTFDKRDRPLEARKGYFLGVEVLEGGPEAGGAVQFFRVTPDVRGYVPLTKRLVFAARARWGWLLTNGTNDAPIPVRYLGGGANDNRGFGFQRLSPQLRDSSGNLIPVGGTEEFLGTAELRVEIWKLAGNWFSLVPFLDAGDVTGGGGLDYGNLNYSAGLGVRYDTIIGPVRLDVGFRLNRTSAAGADGLANPDPGTIWAFQLSLGEAF
jgi:outer membrane protein assembly factor BamA